MKKALIIFTKNLVYGKVKTRLAATVGNEKAFEVYKELLRHTYSVIKNTDCDKIIFYTDKIIDENTWKDDYQKQIQIGNNLGEKMMNAFNFCFKSNYGKVVIIGTDCPELSGQIINNSFEKLNKYNVVIGAAADGGYYLLGMKKLYKELFENIEWSTGKVFDKTIERCIEMGLQYYLLPTLHDVDEEKDLPYMKAMP